MFLHLGGNVIIPMKDIVAVIDMEHRLGEASREFLKTNREEDFVVDISKGKPKSFIVVSGNDHNWVYLSPISAVTLKKRSRIISYISYV